MLKRRVAKEVTHACKMTTQISHNSILSQCRLVDGVRNAYSHRSKHSGSSVGFHSNMPTRCLLKRFFGNNGDVKLIPFQRLAWFPNSVFLMQPALFSWRYRFYGAIPDESSDGVSGFVCKGKKSSTVATTPSRAARRKAQKALMDYLHGTRSIDFIDAEHISRNSPGFLMKLLARIGDEEDAGRSMSKFFRYHPINEFEPFFESLGVKESELPNVIPSDMMFLSDDKILLRNFRLLCNYGVPRSRIGKMYLEASEIFRYEPAVLTAQLEAYEKLGLDVPTVVKLISCCSSLLAGSHGVNKEFVSVFKSLKDMGFGYNWISRCLSESNTYHWGKMLRMLEFLDEMGCNKEDMKSLIRMHPWFLFNESGKKVYVITGLLLKLGLKMENILLLLLQNPQILSGSFVKNLHQSIQFLSEIGMEEGEIANMICSHPNAMGRCMLKKPRTVLSSQGLDQNELRDIIIKDPSQLAVLASQTKMTTILATHNRNHPLEKTDFLLKLGFVESTNEMAVA